MVCRFVAVLYVKRCGAGKRLLLIVWLSITVRQISESKLDKLPKRWQEQRI